MAMDVVSLEEAISQLLDGLEVDLVDLELRQGSLVVTVSRTDGLDLASLTEAARAVSDFLDEHEHLTSDEPFELEVTSPGLERRLRRPEHFRQVVGSMIAVRTKPGTDGDRRIEGTLRAVDDAGIVIVPAEGASERAVNFDAIDRAHTVFDWKAALAADKRTRASEHEAADGPVRTSISDQGQDHSPISRAREIEL